MGKWWVLAPSTTLSSLSVNESVADSLKPFPKRLDQITSMLMWSLILIGKLGV